MGTFDPVGDFLRIAEHYRRLSDEELLQLLPQVSELTPSAQHALTTEVHSRGLEAKMNSDETRSPESRFDRSHASFKREPPHFNKLRGDDPDANNLADIESPYEEDRQLVDLCTVWSVRDALKVQRILDVSGIPFYMGDEKATGVDSVTSNFGSGVVVRIMQVGIPWARGPIQHYEPEDDPTPKEPAEEPGDLTVRCPRCHSEEVVFESRDAVPGKAVDENSHEFRWQCDSCGHHWEDDGVAEEERPEDKK
jgi:DNA-directed RNA polymerase subunit M/transcription elongation factor TFIIS